MKIEMSTNVGSPRGPFPHGGVVAALLVVAIWLVLLWVFHPGVIWGTDDVNYTTQALRFADSGSLESGSYYFDGLLIQDPPLRAVHVPGYSMLLGSFFWATGIGATDLAAHEALPSLLNYLLLVPVALLLFVALGRCTRSAWVPWVGLVGFLGSPLVVLLANRAMAETAVLAIAFFVLLLAPGIGGSERGTVVSAGAGGLLGIGLLVRQSLIFLVPVIGFLLWRKSGRRQAMAFLGSFTLLAVVALMLSSGRLRWPSSTLGNILDALGRSPIEGLRAIGANLVENVGKLFTYWPDARYTVSKVILSLLAGATFASYRLAWVRRNPYATAVVSALALNTVALFLLYDVFGWRGLRVSMHFIAPAIVVLAMAIDGMGGHARKAATGALAIFVAGTLSASAYILGATVDTGPTRTDLTTLTPIVEECLEDIERPAVVLLDTRLHRVRLTHPFDTWVLVSHTPAEGELAAVDAKIEFDCVVVRDSFPRFDDFKVKVASSSPFSAYHRTDPTDLDGDGIDVDRDNCPDAINPTQRDKDHDGVGNACDPDVDGDGIENAADNCPAHANATQSDSDSDGPGDRCDPIDDNDPIVDS